MRFLLGDRLEEYHYRGVHSLSSSVGPKIDLQDTKLQPKLLLKVVMCEHPMHSRVELITSSKQNNTRHMAVAFFIWSLTWLHHIMRTCHALLFGCRRIESDEYWHDSRIVGTMLVETLCQEDIQWIDPIPDLRSLNMNGKRPRCRKLFASFLSNCFTKAVLGRLMVELNRQNSCISAILRTWKMCSAKFYILSDASTTNAFIKLILSCQKQVIRHLIRVCYVCSNFVDPNSIFKLVIPPPPERK